MPASFLGLVVKFGGLLCFVLIAGIPSQDPSAKLRASSDFHSRIAGLLLGAGLALFAIFRKRVALG